MAIRNEVEEIVREHGADPAKIATEICVYMADKFDLEGNGWFDDDEVVGEALSSADRKIYW